MVIDSNSESPRQDPLKPTYSTNTILHIPQDLERDPRPNVTQSQSNVVSGGFCRFYFVFFLSRYEPLFIVFLSCILHLVHGGWGNWSPWSNCPVTCDVGWSQRVRECNNPKPRYNGTACKESESSERRTCSTYVTCGGEYNGDHS